MKCHLAFEHLKRCDDGCEMMAFGLELSHCMLKVPALVLRDSSCWVNVLGVFDKICLQNLNMTSEWQLDEAVLQMLC